MSAKRRWGWAVGAAMATALASGEASAFCGFYVSGADGKLFNNATEVVLMREGTRTVLSMQNRYQGPPEDFAMVVPVPVVLQKENVKTLPREVFERLEKLTAPRLVEYWEQDPCPKPQGIGLGSIGTIGHGAGTGSGTGFGAGRGEASVKIEAQFEVGEYDVVILSASDSMGLDAWLRENHYKIPDGSEPVLKPYVQSGWKFFVAKVDPKKVSFDKGAATLSPLRFHYDADAFSLPVRLGLLNSPGTQDLIVHVLSPQERYEVANFPNVTIPTNIDVSDGAKKSFASFYATLFDKTLAKHPGAVVTEYAWESSSCDPCPTPPLNVIDLALLGADQLPSTADKLTSASMRATAAVKDVKAKGLPAEVASRVLRQRATSQARACLTQALSASSTQEGELEITLSVDPKGQVTGAKAARGKKVDDKLASCIEQKMTGLEFPEPEGGKGATVTATLDLKFRAPPPGSGPRFVVTRLHARYSAKSLGEDLVFRAAKPIVGGREFLAEAGGGRALEQGSRADGHNNFQARYAIRHPWTGPITCKDPMRGVWGGPPHGASPPPQAALDLAVTPRAAGEFLAFLGGSSKGKGEDEVLKTATVLPGDIVPSPNPPFVGAAAEPGATAEPEAPPSPEASPSAPVPAAPPATPPTAGGCAGCQVSGGAGIAGALGAAGALLLLLAGVSRRKR